MHCFNCFRCIKVIQRTFIKDWALRLFVNYRSLNIVYIPVGRSPSDASALPASPLGVNGNNARNDIISNRVNPLNKLGEISLISFRHKEQLNLKSKKLWEELIPYFPLTRQGPHRKRRAQQFLYCCMCIRCRGNVFTESLATNGKGINIQTHRLMEGIYEVRR
jgi:hypothetical protein